jgi:DNA-binding SARP family transcriptional activator/predicted ATPase
LPLRIFLLGQFKLVANDQPIELPSRPAQSLLAYLALNAGVTHRREQLASVLWGGTTETNARSYLRRALWQMRKSLESASLAWEEFLQVSDITVMFDNQSDYWLDVDELLMTMESCPIDEIIEAVQLYHGDLLAGFYDEWIEIERDRVQAAYYQKMNHLLGCLIQAKRWEEVLKWGEHWIGHSFSPEPAYRALMIAHARLGNPGMVHASYQRCVVALDRDLEIKPSPETTRLFEQIRRGDLEAAEAIPSISIVLENKQPAFFDQKTPRQIENTLFVARERELEQLNGFLNRVISEKGRVVFVSGEAGSGKTALINEFARRARESRADLIFAKGNCNAHTGIGDPYLPFREIMELLSGDVQARFSAGAISRDYAQSLWTMVPHTIQALMEGGPDIVDTFVSGAALLERAKVYAPGGAEWLTRLDTYLKQEARETIVQGSLQSDLFKQYSKVLQLLARKAPMVLVVDDMQWADLGSISLLFHLGRNLSGTRILIIGAYRPEEVSLGRAGERHPLEQIVNELQRESGEIVVDVDRAKNRDFLEALLDCDPNRLDKNFREMLYQQTRGQPLFTIELLRGMKERGDLVVDGEGRWIEGAKLDWEMLPPRVEAVLAERIGRMEPSLQKVLRAASVQGELFTAEVIARVQSRSEREILSLLSSELDKKHRLVQAQSIRRIGDQLISSYQFLHIIVQKFLYNSLDEVERVYLHEQVGDALEAILADREEIKSFAPQLARHFQEAKITEKAINYLQIAGEKALMLSAYREAIGHLTKGLELLASELPDSKKEANIELSLQFELAKAWRGSFGNTPEMAQAFIRVKELSQESGKTSSLCLALSGLSVYHYVKAEHQQALYFAKNTLTLSQEIGDPLLIALGHWNLGIVLFAQGEFSGAREHIGQLLAAYDPKIHQQEFVSSHGVDAGASAMAYDACCLWILGYPDQAVQRSNRAFDIAREYHHAFTLADVLCFGGCHLYAMIGDIEALETYSDELNHLSEDRGFAGWLAGAYCFRGEAICMRGQLAEGVGLIEEGIALSLSMGEYLQLPRMQYLLAKAYSRMGDLVKGWENIGKAFDSLEQSGERTWESSLYQARASLHTMEGNFEKAETDLEKAIETSRRQGARSWELRAAIDLANLWKEQRELEKAHKLLFDIYSWFTEGFDTPDLKKAKLLLETLA